MIEVDERDPMFGMWSPVVNRFLDCVRINTQSCESETSPSSEGQWTLARLVKSELEAMGLKPHLSDTCILDCLIPATPGFNAAVVVTLSAHFDTAPDASGDVKPLIHRFDGKPIELPLADPETGKKVVLFDDGKNREHRFGQRIITSSGDSLLGADCKAGLAGIMEAVARLLSDEEEHPHGPIELLFFPDEEQGIFNANMLPDRHRDVLLTVDGGKPPIVDVGCFIGNKVTATFESKGIKVSKDRVNTKMSLVFTGRSAHPGLDGGNLADAKYAASHFVRKVLDTKKLGFYIQIKSLSTVKSEVDIFFDKACISVNLLKSFTREADALNVGLEYIISEYSGEKEFQVWPALLAACYYVSAVHHNTVPPWRSKDKQSFCWVDSVKMENPEKVVVNSIPRTFDEEEAEQLVALLCKLADDLKTNDHFSGLLEVLTNKKKYYRNIKYAIQAHPWVLEPLREAMAMFDMIMKEFDARGGTDVGIANMDLPDLPGPNMWNGAQNIHGTSEYIWMDHLELLPVILVEAMERYAMIKRSHL
ncbi:MAG: M20/M25/M40 family metallo-hydrolase [Patescibacteria group bacterium]|jgi:di/tripeptidase